MLLVFSIYFIDGLITSFIKPVICSLIFHLVNTLFFCLLHCLNILVLYAPQYSFSVYQHYLQKVHHYLHLTSGSLHTQTVIVWQNGIQHFHNYLYSAYMAEQNFWIVHSGETPGVLWYLLFCRCLILDLLPIYHPLIMKLFMYFQVSLFQSDLRDLHVDFFGVFFL